MTGHLVNFLIVALVILAALFLDSYIGISKGFSS